jgi:glucans biosynthesis protein
LIAGTGLALLSPVQRPSATLRAAVAAATLLAAGVASAFGFDDLAARAQALSQQPPRPPLQAPAELRALSYDQARDIRFRPERGLWRDLGLPFEAMFFHLGYVQTQAVRLHELLPDGTVRPLAYDPAAFDTGRTHIDPAVAQDLGYAGFRIHHALNSPAYKDELVVFQGASYFRALGAGQRYGLSARGLAIDTVGGAGEEFPRFSEFWLQRPAPGGDRVVVLALLESARATGAYRFEIAPGSETVTTVRARLFLRPGITTLGIAPLTSMFFFGENQPRAEDFRPEVHDSDGLLMANGNGEWLWRPLQNPARTLVSSFALRSPRGFGLMQRDRRFASYEDTEAPYERRPSAWVEPVGDWGEGRVELMQFPTPDETHDNVVAYWVPARLPAPGQPLDIEWRVRWQGDALTRPPGGWTAQTRSGRSFAALAESERQFIVDFQGPAIDALPADATVRAVASTDTNAEVTEAITWRNESGRAWRMALRVRLRNPSQPTELRAFLQHATHTLTETWTHIVLPR